MVDVLESAKCKLTLPLPLDVEKNGRKEDILNFRQTLLNFLTQKNTFLFLSHMIILSLFFNSNHSLF